MKSALFERSEKEIALKGSLSKLKISDGLSETLPLLSYLGITYRKNEVIGDVFHWFERSFAFSIMATNTRCANSLFSSEEIKRLVLL